MKVVPLYSPRPKLRNTRTTKDIPERIQFSVETAWGADYLVETTTAAKAIQAVIAYQRQLDEQNHVENSFDVPVDSVKMVHYDQFLIDAPAAKRKYTRKAKKK